jgi:hypothetical protein
VSATPVAIAGLAVAAIEITGLPGAVILLLPLAILLIVIARALRTRQPTRQAEIMSVIHTDRPLSGDENEAAAEAAVPAPDLPKPEAKATDWPQRIEAAEAAKDLASVASHYLSFAREEIAAGQAERAAEHLRSSVRAAAKGKFAAIQAEARLELADLARVAGDLTTACEHWQIARGLFHQLQQAAELGETEKLMQQHGCPTDWVLNDF